MTTLLARDGYEGRLVAWTVVFPTGGFPNVHAEWVAAAAAARGEDSGRKSPEPAPLSEDA